MSEALEAAYFDIFSVQRSFDDGPGGDSPFGGRIEEKVGICTFEKDPPERRAVKASYTFEYFRLLHDLNNMRIACNGGAPQLLTAEQREILKDAAL